MITKYFSVFLLSVALLLASCATGGSTTGGGDVRYVQARNYFFRNDAKQPDGLLVMHSQAEMDRYFGPAAVMGKGGEPTQIDFSKSFAVAKVLPVTDRPTQIEPRRIERTGKKAIRVVWHVTVSGSKQSYAMQPMCILVIDNQYKDFALSEQVQ